MSLAPGEERVLADLETRLRWSDPRLAAKLVLFGHRTGRGPAGETLSPWRGRRRQAIRRLFVLSTIMIVAVVGTALAIKGARAERSSIVACREGRSATSLWWPGFCRPLTCRKGHHAQVYPPVPAGEAKCLPDLLPEGSPGR